MCLLHIKRPSNLTIATSLLTMFLFSMMFLLLRILIGIKILEAAYLFSKSLCFNNKLN